MIKTQLRDQIELNQHQASEFSRISHENSVAHRMLGHKDSEITRLMNLVSQRDGSLQEPDVVIADLQSRCPSSEARLSSKRLLRAKWTQCCYEGPDRC